jgi:hypothetical protein
MKPSRAKLDLVTAPLKMLQRSGCAIEQERDSRSRMNSRVAERRSTQGLFCLRFVSGHGFSRAENGLNHRGFSPWLWKPAAARVVDAHLSAARLKPCPDTNQPLGLVFEQAHRMLLTFPERRRA